MNSTHIYEWNGKMARTPDEGEAKRTYGLTLNPSLVEQLQNEQGIGNLSGWVNEQIREAVLNHRVILECNCGAASGPHKWIQWNLVCPTCTWDHKILDRRKRIKILSEVSPSKLP